ncbi:MAG: DEAD/DEAH box helicase family protein [Prevotella sp.]|nr:DEAD/DEAH box helicase family protein [Prevotella sp.]
MELKKYQKQALHDLEDYVELLNKGGKSLSEIYADYWRQRGVDLSLFGSKYVRPYVDSVKGVPRVTLKVPTAGGKTFMACNALKTIFNNLQAGMYENKVVAWFVPSDTILKQTLRNLQDPRHPYRQKIDALFAHHVVVVDKEAALAAQGISPANMKENLTIFVLSVQSFVETVKKTKSAKSQEQMKPRAYRENGNLMEHANYYTRPKAMIEGADKTALIQVIAQQNPLVIVDECHRFGADLRVEMLNNLSPRFILELTATPKENNNVISFVDAMSLKRENMVKLPVLVVNKRSAADVIKNAILMRRSLEKHALETEQNGGRYIRPIVLFQAQPKLSDYNMTFDKIKKELVDIGIPEEQIKIKTAEKDELKGIDLLSSECPVRYIITVNALQEGWDCPFAYILATLANRTSSVEVEQILGRILRQPYTTQHADELLNMSYVFTNSADFTQTVERIVNSMIRLGYSRKDFRDMDEPKSNDTAMQIGSYPETPSVEPDGQFNLFDNTSNTVVPSTDQAEQQDIFELTEEDKNAIKDRIDEPENVDVDEVENEARKMGEEYKHQMDETTEETNTIPDMSTYTYPMQDDYAEEAKQLILPVFMKKAAHKNMFDDDCMERLNPEMLSEGFDLLSQDSNVDFTVYDAQSALIDLQKSGDDYVPKMSYNAKGLEEFRRQFISQPTEKQRERLATNIARMTGKSLNCVAETHIRQYVLKTIQHLDENKLLYFFDHISEAKDIILLKINSLLEKHRKNKFVEWINTGRIEVRPSYKLLEKVTITKHELKSVDKGLYVAEESGNNFENKVISAIADRDNVLFWHRNQERKEFCINGFINHYPDFIVRTKSFHTVMVETKGEHLKNEDTRNKIWLGNKWADLAGSGYHYYMVFEDNPMEGAITVNQLINYLDSL